MAEVAVTVLATSPDDYAKRIDLIKPFVRRLHIDISDGVFTPTKTIDLAQAYDIDDVPTDLHLMVSHPGQQVEMVISFGPSLVVCHEEAAANWPELFGQWRELGIKVGLALRADSAVSAIKHILPDLDHVLVFTGDHIGFNHSHFAEGTLAKIKEIKLINPNVEVGVDGGLTPKHAKEAVLAGANVINAGGYVHEAKDPKAAYSELVVAAAEASDDDQAA